MFQYLIYILCIFVIQHFFLNSSLICNQPHNFINISGRKMKFSLKKKPGMMNQNTGGSSNQTRKSIKANLKNTMHSRALRIYGQAKWLRGNALIRIGYFCNGWLYKEIIVSCAHGFLNTKNSSKQRIQIISIKYKNHKVEGQCYLLDESEKLIQINQPYIKDYTKAKIKQQKAQAIYMAQEQPSLPVYNQNIQSSYQLVSQDKIFMKTKEDRKYQNQQAKIQFQKAQVQQIQFATKQDIKRENGYLIVKCWGEYPYQQQTGEKKYQYNLHLKQMEVNQETKIQAKLQDLKIIVLSDNSNLLQEGDSGSPIYLGKKYVGIHAASLTDVESGQKKVIGTIIDTQILERIERQFQNIELPNQEAQNPDSEKKPQFFKLNYQNPQREENLGCLVKITAEAYNNDLLMCVKFSNGILINEKQVLLPLENIYQYQCEDFQKLELRLRCRFKNTQIQLKKPDQFQQLIKIFIKNKKQLQTYQNENRNAGVQDNNKLQLLLETLVSSLIILDLQKSLENVNPTNFYQLTNRDNLYLTAYNLTLNNTQRKLCLSHFDVKIQEQKISLPTGSTQLPIIQLASHHGQISPFKAGGPLIQKKDGSQKIVGIISSIQGKQYFFFFNQESVFHINTKSPSLHIQYPQKPQQQSQQPRAAENSFMRYFKPYKIFCVDSSDSSQQSVIVPQNNRFKKLLQANQTYIIYAQLLAYKYRKRFQLNLKITAQNPQEINHITSFGLYIGPKQVPSAAPNESLRQLYKKQGQKLILPQQNSIKAHLKFQSKIDKNRNKIWQASIAQDQDSGSQDEPKWTIKSKQKSRYGEKEFLYIIIQTSQRVNNLILDYEKLPTVQ